MDAEPAVMVFVAAGCGACKEFMPRLRARARGLSVWVHDVTQRRAGQLAAEYRIRATPTAVFRTRRGTYLRRVGALPDAEIDRLVALALR